MGKKLYVGNLAYSVRDNDLEQAFGEFGAIVSAKVMMERDTGRSKGFGFVEMGTDVGQRRRFRVVGIGRASVHAPGCATLSAVSYSAITVRS